VSEIVGVGDTDGVAVTVGLEVALGVSVLVGELVGLDVDVGPGIGISVGEGISGTSVVGVSELPAVSGKETGFENRPSQPTRIIARDNQNTKVILLIKVTLSKELLS